MIFFVPALPHRILSPNGGTRDEKRNGQMVVDAMYELSSSAYHAVLNNVERPYPAFSLACITMTYHIAHGAKKCPRCRQRCECFRPRTPTNFGGDCSTPVLDALVKHGIIAGKTLDHVGEARLRIRRVDEAADEGILVEIEEVSDLQNASAQQ